jgi:hypothetical protein
MPVPMAPQRARSLGKMQEEWVLALVLPMTGCVFLGNPLPSLNLVFLTYKTRCLPSVAMIGYALGNSLRKHHQAFVNDSVESATRSFLITTGFRLHPFLSV